MVLLAFATALFSLLLRIYDMWERWHNRRAPVPTAHPLETALKDIAAAVRERAPDFHLRIDK